MKKIFLLFIAFMLLGLNVMAEEKFVLFKYDLTAEYEPQNFFKLGKGDIYIIGRTYDCDKDSLGCNLYSLDSNGELTELNETTDSMKYQMESIGILKIGEKVGNDYSLLSCNGDCVTIEVKSVRNLYLQADDVVGPYTWGANVVEVFDSERNVSKFGIYDWKGNVLVEPSENYEPIQTIKNGQSDGEKKLDEFRYLGLKNKSNNDYIIVSESWNNKTIPVDTITAKVRENISFDDLQRIVTYNNKQYYLISNGETIKIADKNGYFSEKTYDDEAQVFEFNNEVVVMEEKSLNKMVYVKNGAKVNVFTAPTKLNDKIVEDIVATPYGGTWDGLALQDLYGNNWFFFDNVRSSFGGIKLGAVKLMTDTVIDKTNDVTITMSEFITKNYEIKTKILSKEKTAFSEEFIKNIKLSSNKEKVIDIYNFDIEMTDGTDLPNAKYVVKIPTPKNIDKYNPVRMVTLDKDSKILEKEIELTKDKDYYTFEIGVADLNTTSFALVGDELAQVPTGIIFSGQIILLSGVCAYLIIKAKKKEKVYSI